MYDLARFSLSDMTRCGIDLRKMGAGASSMEEAAGRVVRLLHEQLGDGQGGRACALVRLFVTLPYAELDAEQQGFVRDVLGGEPERATMKCLTLLATAGARPEWNSRRSSAGHKALPLQSGESVARSPMIAQLLKQLGVETSILVEPDPQFVVDATQHTFNVFHVPQAAGSPYIPAQAQFVIPHGICSVLGFGGLLPSGELFATILFTSVSIPREVADLFKTLALNVKVALLPFAGAKVLA